MKKTSTILIVILIVILAITGTYYITSKKTLKKTPIAIETDTKDMLVGNDKDAHGCIGSAGYTWCEVKNKCLRVWEEKCDIEAENAIKQLLATKYNKPTSDVKVNVIKATKNHAIGSVSFAPFDGNNEGGMFLAVKIEIEWQLVFDGNGSINCTEIDNLGFPKEMLTGLCD
jgi:maltose-binding protein MalE